MATIGQDYLGQYRLLSMIRAGKTCQVWEAIDDSTRNKVALKVVRPEFLKDRNELMLMRHEFAVGQKLDHPNVIRIYELVQDSQKIFLAMELFNVPNMKQWILQKSDTLLSVMPKVVMQAAEGIAYLHRQGYVHRDIKPDNFLIDSEGNVKLIDFALCEKRKGFMARLLKTRGKIQGTRSYMSPEQIRGQILEPTADVYSFGCTIYELISGKAPFTGVNTNDLLNKHLRSPPPSLEVASRNVTPEFARLAKSMIAKEPAKRPQSMDDVVKELKVISLFKTSPIAPE